MPCSTAISMYTRFFIGRRRQRTCWLLEERDPLFQWNHFLKTAFRQSSRPDLDRFSRMSNAALDREALKGSCDPVSPTEMHTRPRNSEISPASTRSPLTRLQPTFSHRFPMSWKLQKQLETSMLGDWKIFGGTKCYR